jgi:integrase/recombinase XerD
MASRRIKKSITEKEYKMLMSHTKGDESLKAFNQKRFLMLFWLLYYSGARVNELSQIRYKHIREIVQNSETVIITYKTKNERILYFSDQAVKEMKKYFDLSIDEDHYVITSWDKPKEKLHEISLISLVNKYMKKVLGSGFTSHSFRQGLLTEMGSKSINPKIIQSFIGHSDVKTTLRYIKPTADDVKMSLVR